MAQWIPREVMPILSEYEPGKAYVLGYSYDPVMQKKLGQEYPVPFSLITFFKVFCEKNEAL